MHRYDQKNAGWPDKREIRRLLAVGAGSYVQAATHIQRGRRLSVGIEFE
jgi:hypothetical protein